MVTEITSAVQGAQTGTAIGGPVGGVIGGTLGLLQGIGQQRKQRQLFREQRNQIRLRNQEIRKEATRIGRAATRTTSEQQAQFGAAGIQGATTQVAQLDVLRESYLNQARILAGVDVAGANARSPKNLGQKAGSELKRAGKKLKKLF